MNPPHVIRLRGPWDYELWSALPRTELLASGTTELAVGQPDAAEGVALVRWRRRFGRPTGLESSERVWLVIDADIPVLAVRLNARPLAGHSTVALPLRQLVGEWLRERNTLEIDLAPTPEGNRKLDVSLEIAEELSADAGRVQ